MTPKVLCSICGADDWRNVDEYRLKPDGMAMCMRCGFVTYPSRIAASADVKEFYRAEYRQAPTVQNVYTGQRKLHYHNEFLGELFKGWKKEGRKPVVFEIGAAFGMFLKWMRDEFPGAEVHGSELTLTYRRCAFHEYGLTLGEDFDPNRQYDLIASYKVAEHIPGIENELPRYAQALKPDGFLYVSVPTWFHTMSNFGTDGFSLEYYYHPNHINVWTRKLFETLLAKSGLEIVKRDTVIYDATYLCRRNDAMKAKDPVHEEPAVILDHLDRIKRAAMLHDQSRFDDAVQTFSAFPDARIAAYEMKRADWHKKGFDAIHAEVLEPALLACPESAKISFFCADLAMRYDRWELAIKYLERTLKQKPNDPGGLMALGHCFRKMGDHSAGDDEKLKFWREAREVMRYLRTVSFQHSQEAITWIFADNAKLPMPTEADAIMQKSEKGVTN